MPGTDSGDLGPPADTAVQPSPRYSVVVLHWNGLAHTERCLASLAAQRFRDFETIVVDNGSTDGSRGRLRTLCAGCVRLLCLGRNLGTTGGNNAGLRLARGEFVARLDNDCDADAGWLEALDADVTAAPRQVGMWASRVMVDAHRGVFDSVGLLVYPDGTGRPRGWLEPDRGQYDASAEILAPSGCAALYRRSMLEEIGPLDERYFACLDDLDLGLRAQTSGWRCRYVPGARVYHVKGATFGRHTLRKGFLVERNRVYNAVKHLPTRWLLTSPCHVLARYLAQGWAALGYRGPCSQYRRRYSWLQLALTVWEAWAAALDGLPPALRERRRLRALRRLGPREWAGLLARHRLPLGHVLVRD
ncbi:MAG: glycosyltransferase family 2 protein [Planctomycetes bacterium]|nr:glycosyltransferase family 2 protein [Planctomycetota bacterium]